MGGGVIEGWVWPMGPNPTFDPTQCLNNLSVYVYLLQSPQAFFYIVHSVIEEIAVMKREINNFKIY
jgi:hypothetical protein